MKVFPLHPPRVFEVGFGRTIVMHDCGRVHLEPDEQVTFVAPSGAEYDVARKDWGFYATPSMNGRLAGFGWRSLLVKNRLGRFFVLLAEIGKEAELDAYLKEEQLRVVARFDDEADLARLEAAFSEQEPF